MPTIPNQTLSLPYLRLILGIVALILSLYSSIGFLSQGATGIAFVAVLAFCIVAEFVKCLFAGDVAFYSALKMPDKALFALCVVIVLFVLSIMAEVWFLVSNPLKDAVQLDQATARSATLQQQISAKQAQLATCNPTYLTRCVNPRTHELQALQSELDKALVAEAQQSSAAANRKFWQQAATALGTTAENLQMGLAILRSVISEILGIVLIAQFQGFKRLQNFHGDAMRQVLPDRRDDHTDGLLAEIAQLKLELAKKP